jgi:hypothetical protein
LTFECEFVELAETENGGNSFRSSKLDLSSSWL